MSDYASELAKRYVREWPQGAEFLGVDKTIEGAIREALAKAAEAVRILRAATPEHSEDPWRGKHGDSAYDQAIDEAVGAIRALGAREGG